MNKPISIILIILFGIQMAIGQEKNEINDWDKIVIGDAYGGWSHFDNKYQVKKDDLLLTTLNKPDSTFKKVDSKLISELINLLNNPSDSRNNPLSFFGKDSLWLNQNAEQLWNEFKNDRKTTKEIDSIAINTIRDIKKANRVAWTIQGSNWTDDYPIVYVHLINKNDTISLSTNGQYPYMLPWHFKGQKLYNHRISEIIADLLPDIKQSNKERLNGNNFNYHLIEKIYRAYIEDKENYIEARNRYSSTFKLLQKGFEIKKAEITDMSSIEWGGNWGRPCLEMSLKDSTISKNIEFYTIYGTNKLLNSPKNIIDKKDKLIESLEENPVYKYTLKCESCLGEIHWVKSQSLSKEAEKSFKEDLADNGIDKNKYKGKYKNAIFYELTEYRNSKRSFSRWIFLTDGTLILWQLRGNYLMNLPDSYVENQGYVCKEVESKEITMPNNGYK
jgi:hypothetical protein